ncbi:LysR family transcriptional regulator [Variovorax ginsengisoli]|uniref:LysR family transcriptional regulator n=1 Tax=Variovorax ginsengisoli TaxID=363844 RepID=A0ABT8S9M7_9BURK|nr:LysR family transcriptional regulator [Variovorax ginsengisoli]MDN8616444.1 LysR family transcriptional regulator [Variovorax ginsengisoli]MDO1535614.1 LysR family transcriptional regulator [Variovorax ginsengisoli]
MDESIQSQLTAERLIGLNDLRVFAHVASLTNFSLAAAALNVHRSSVSRSVSRLESALRVSLLHRPARKIHLTRSGIALNERCVEISVSHQRHHRNGR